MAERIIDTTMLTAEANALREKGLTGQIEFKSNGFADAIGNVESAKPEQSKPLTLGAAAPSTVTPDSGKVLSSVPVVLNTSVIKAENIKKGVQMLGITGTYEGEQSETWVMNEVLKEMNVIYNGTFYSNGEVYTHLETDISKDVFFLYYSNMVSMVVYDDVRGWYTQVHRTINLDKPATGDFLTWLQANAVKQ